MHNLNADALSRAHDKIERAKSEDVKTLLPKFTTSSEVPRIVVQSIKSNNSQSVLVEEAHTTFPTFRNSQFT